MCSTILPRLSGDSLGFSRRWLEHDEFFFVFWVSSIRFLVEGEEEEEEERKICCRILRRSMNYFSIMCASRTK